MKGEVPRGVVNRAVLDAPRFKARLESFKARYGA
jgi:hypothetical protein